MHRWGLLRGDLIENVILWDGDLEKWSPPEGLSAERIPDEVGSLWRKVAGGYEPPAISAPVATMNDRLAAVEIGLASGMKAVQLPADAASDAPILLRYVEPDLLNPNETGRWRVRDPLHAAERTLAARADGIPQGSIAVWNDTLNVFEFVANLKLVRAANGTPTALQTPVPIELPRPFPQRIATGRAVPNNTTAIASSDLAGFSVVTRVAAGRYRFTFSSPQPDTNYIAFPDLLDTTTVRKIELILAKTMTYVEIGVFSLATNFPASDPTELNVFVERLMK